MKSISRLHFLPLIYTSLKDDLVTESVCVVKQDEWGEEGYPSPFTVWWVQDVLADLRGWGSV